MNQLNNLYYFLDDYFGDRPDLYRKGPCHNTHTIAKAVRPGEDPKRYIAATRDANFHMKIVEDNGLKVVRNNQATGVGRSVRTYASDEIPDHFALCEALTIKDTYSHEIVVKGQKIFIPIRLEVFASALMPAMKGGDRELRKIYTTLRNKMLPRYLAKAFFTSDAALAKEMVGELGQMTSPFEKNVTVPEKIKEEVVKPFGEYTSYDRNVGENGSRRNSFFCTRNLFPNENDNPDGDDPLKDDDLFGNDDDLFEGKDGFNLVSGGI